MVEIAGIIVGLLYLWFEYHASVYVWVTGVIMPAIYIYIYYDAGLYADFAINIYYVLAAVYGLWKWSLFPTPSPVADARASSEGRGDCKAETYSSPLTTGEGSGERPIIHTPTHLYPVLATVALLLTVAIGFVLDRWTDSTVAWWDATTTALSIVALWMLAHKHIEQWLVWIVVDMICCGLYIYKDLYLTSALYALYTVIAVLGYRKWGEALDL